MMHLCTILCVVFLLAAVMQTAAVKQDTGVVSASVGDDVTLHCFYDSQVAMHFSWYRHTLGGGPKLLSSVYKYDKPSKVFQWMEENPRFSVQREDGMNHLHISDVRLSDSATYFCGSSHSNVVEFGEGVFLSVEGSSFKEVVQGPACETIHPGGSVTFNCTVRAGTCREEPSVYWFRHGFHHGIIHTQGNGWRHVSTPGSSSQSCVYHLQKTDVASSDTGTYYCAVASCGRILFGAGSELLVQADAEDQTAPMRMLFWLSIIRAGILLSFMVVCLLVYIRKTRKNP